MGRINITAHDVDQLAVIIKNRLERIHYRPALIEAFLAQTGLTLDPSPVERYECGPFNFWWQ